MKVATTAPSEREVTISGTVDELAALYMATRPGRRTKEQYAQLEAFGTMVRGSDKDIQKAAGVLETEDAQRKVKRKPPAPGGTPGAEHVQ